MIAFVIYLIAGNAEVNRGPFDLPEAESELTAGYHTEYSGMHFGLFYVAEFVNLFIIAGVAATIFLGGWMPLHISGWEGFNAVMDYIPGFVWFFGKTFFVVWLLMWIKWTFPRLRVDQILTLEWKYLVPIGLVNLLLMVIVVVFKLCILGMKTTSTVYLLTEQYPENRKKLSRLPGWNADHAPSMIKMNIGV